MSSRRNFLAALTVAATSAAMPSGARAQTAAIGAVRVDTSRLEAQGWGGRAAEIRRALERELVAALGPNLRRGAGPTLNVAVRGVFLNSYAGGGGGGRFGGGGNQGSDSFDSEATLVGPGNRIVATYPVLSTVQSSAGGPWYLPDIDDRRLAGLVKHNAAWIKRYVAG